MEQDKKAEAKVERDRKLGKHRSPLQVMAGLIYMIKPLLGWMFVAIFMGCLGNLAATFLTIFGGYGMLDVAGIDVGFSFFTVVTIRSTRIFS